MERKIYSGASSLEQLCVGDSVIDIDISQWNRVVTVPQIIADSWACLFNGSYISTKSKVGEAPMKDWQKGLGIVVGIDEDLLSARERLLLLRRNIEGSYALYKSVNSRIKNE